MSTKIRKKSLVNNSISKKLSRFSNIRPDTLKDMLEQTLQTCFQEECGQDPPIVTGCYEENVSKANLFKERNRKGECWALYDKVLGTNELTSIGFQGCKIAPSFMRVLDKIFEQFSLITVLILQRCSLDVDGLSLIVSTLQCIEDLNLDENFIPIQNYGLLLLNKNILKHLSLKFCKINEAGAHDLAKSLEFRDPKTQHLLSLNLSFNHINSNGAIHLAKALRTNRELESLSLIHNWIDDEGAIALSDVLQKFKLNEEESGLRLERQVLVLLRKKELMEELYIVSQENSNKTTKVSSSSKIPTNTSKKKKNSLSKQ